MSSAAHVALAVDLGATQCRAALVTSEGEILSLERHDTPASSGPEGVIGAVVRAIEAVRSHSSGARPRVLGVAAPGPVDPNEGIVYDAPNLTGWVRVPLGLRLVETVGLPTFVQNDGNLAALGEARFGAGRGHDPLVYLTVSSGVGGGVVIGGQILGGALGLAGELGHVIVQAGGPRCNLGHPGCLEALASGTAIAKRAREALVRGATSGMLDEAGSLERIDAAVVARCAEQGDPLASEILHDAAEHLGYAIAGLINVFDPARVVIGGGVAEAWPVWSTWTLEAVDRVVMAKATRNVDIVQAACRDSGVVGAAIYALERLRS